MSRFNYCKEQQVGNITIKASLGNLVHAEADALVVPQFLKDASEGGVGDAIIEAGAERGVVDEYYAERERRGSFNFGEAFATLSHGGPTKWLIHVISVGSGREREFSTINTAVYNALDAADKAGLSRIAFPMLGTGGITGYLDARQSAQAMLMAVSDYASRNRTSSVKGVELVVYGNPRSYRWDPAYRALRDTLFNDVLPQATARRPEDKSFIQRVAQYLGVGKRRLDS